jgi:hypothetical protein
MAQAVGKILLSIAINMAVNAILGAIFKKKGPTSTFNLNSTITDNEAPIAMIYGESRSGGNTIWQTTNGDRKWAYKIVSYGLGPYESVDKSSIKFGDMKLENKGSHDYGDGNHYVNIYYGTGNQQIDEVVNKTRKLINPAWAAAASAGQSVAGIKQWLNKDDDEDDWFSWPDTLTQQQRAMITGGLKHEAYLACVAEANDDLQGDFAVTAVWKGRIVRVYTSINTYVTQWSNNPAWCIMDFLVSDNGCGMEYDDLDIQSFIDSAAYCDEMIDNPDGTQRKRFTLNQLINEKKSRLDHITDMLLTCRGYPTYASGKYGIMIEKPAPVVAHFDHKTMNDLQIWWSTKEEIIDELNVKYIDPGQDWTFIPAPAQADNPLRKPPMMKEVEIPGVTNYYQASHLAWFYLNQSVLSQCFIKFKTDRRALARTCGDVITVSDYIIEWIEKKFRIISMSETMDSQIEITCREYIEELYTDQLGCIYPTAVVGTTSNLLAVPNPVSNITLVEEGWINKDGVHITSVIVNCVTNNTGLATDYVITMSEDGGTTYTDVNKVATFPYRILNVPTQKEIIIGIEAESKTGKRSAKVTESIITVGKDSPPPDVEYVLVETKYWGYRFYFKPVVAPDIAGYKFRYNYGESIYWSSAFPMHDGLVISSPFDCYIIPRGQITVMMKAIDNSGNESDNVAYVKLNLGDELQANVLDETDFHPTWTGTKTNCFISGTELWANDTGESFYGDDAAPFYQTTEGSLFYTTQYLTMTYITSYTPPIAGNIGINIEADGDYRVYYCEAFSDAMWTNDEANFWSGDDNKYFWTARDKWISYTGKFVGTVQEYLIKVEIQGGTTQGQLKELTAYVDVNDITEEHLDVAISASGTRITPRNTFINILRVNMDLQDDLGNALTIKVIDKNPTLGPLIKCYDKDGNAVTGTADITLQGY